MKFQAALFDYGHTLIDFTVPDEALHAAYGEIRERLTQEALAELPQVPDLVERVSREVTRRVEESYEADRLIELDIMQLFEQALAGVGFTTTPETVRWVVETEHTALFRFLRCPSESIDTLKQIHDAGLKIAIISNAHLLAYMMRRDWEALGFAQYVNASLISSEVGRRKPHPEVFLRVLRDLQIAPESAVFVGDRLFDDVGGAHAVGMRAILTQEFRQELPVAGGETPDLVVTRLSEILPYILGGTQRSASSQLGEFPLQDAGVVSYIIEPRAVVDNGVTCVLNVSNEYENQNHDNDDDEGRGHSHDGRPTKGRGLRGNGC